LLLLDNSAWARMVQGAVPRSRADALAELMNARQLVTCVPFLLEVGFSARSSADRKSVMGRLEELPRVHVDSVVEALALEAQQDLTEVGHHRLPLVDLLIAACAHRAEIGVLHYDADYDLLAKHTSLRFESVWLAPAGSL
jgi:predicted nucleic acid-binding protein